jgi:polysaccharide biosynthesis/export protein
MLLNEFRTVHQFFVKDLHMKFQSNLMIVAILWGGAALCSAQSLYNSASANVSATDQQKVAGSYRAQHQLEEFVIGAEDVLAVNVWKEPEISRTVPVRPDGKITLPLIGEIQASGLTAQKLQEEIGRRLATYVSNPDVTVIVQEVKSLKFNIMGEVVKPGSYTLSKPMTVLNAIAIAGGLRDFAKQGNIYVLRVTENGIVRLPFDYKSVIKARKQDLELQPRDTVVVP